MPETTTSVNSQQVIDSSNDLLCSFDKNFTFLVVNKAARQILGYSPKELVGRPLTAYIIEDDLALTRKMLDGLVHVRFVTSLENRLLKKDGTVAHLRWSAYWNDSEQTVYAVATDISSHQETLEKLASSENRFKFLVQNGTDLISIVNEEGQYLFLSNNMERILYHKIENFIGKVPFDYIHPDDQLAVTKTFKSVPAGGSTEIAPFRFKNGRGEWRWIESKITDCRSDPAIKGLVVNSRDITDKKILQGQLQKETELRQKKVTRAVIKGQERERQMIGRELHDNINQMLAVVKLFNEASLGQDKNGHKDFIVKSIEYLSICMNEIRNMSKELTIPKFTEISFQESVQEMIGAINKINKLSVNLFIIGTGMNKINEEVQVAAYRVMQEHVANVVKHAEATILTIIIDTQPDLLKLKMEDNGKGFNMKRKRKGIGITNMINRVEALEGKFHIKAAENKGCTVTVSFPLNITIEDED